MMGPSHRIAGAVAWLAVAPALGMTGLGFLVGGALISAAFAHGWLSPDIDQMGWYPWHHRGVTHFWLWPVLLFLLGGWVGIRFGSYPGMAVEAVAVAWASHIVTDGVFGRVPVLPRIIGRLWSRHRSSHWRYFGIGLKTGGPIETWVALPAFIVAGVYLVWQLVPNSPSLSI